MRKIPKGIAISPKCMKMQSLVPKTTFKGLINASANTIIVSVVNPKYPIELPSP